MWGTNYMPEGTRLSQGGQFNGFFVSQAVD